MQRKTAVGHLAATFTILMWGTTFISTKVLLRAFTPVEILVFRFILSFFILCAAYPRWLKVAERKRELYFAGAGLCGITLYYLLENIALTYTTASNVGIILSVAPFFTALLAITFLHGEKPRFSFYLGFVAAMAGIVLIGYNGAAVLQLNPLGDILAALAAVVWAVYSILAKKIMAWGYNIIQVTRRIFFYGIVFMIPTLFLFDFELELARFAQPVNLFNILFLSIGAGAAGFVTWNYAVRELGAVKTSVYIYLSPVITVITSVIVLGERVTVLSLAGILLTLTGLLLSEWKHPKKEAPVAEEAPSETTPP